MFFFRVFVLFYKDVLFGCHNFVKEDNDKYYLINLLIFLFFCKDLKSYLDTRLTSNNSNALETVSFKSYFHDYVTNNCITNCTHSPLALDVYDLFGI